MEHSEIIEALGGPVAVARAAGRHHSRAVRWQVEGIPAKCWPAVVNLAKAKGEHRVTYEALEAGLPQSTEAAS